MIAWTLVFHLIGMVFWVGTLLVVTQILAIHTEEPSPDTRDTLGRLESRLLRGLAHPGAALMVITGLLLLHSEPDYLRQHWLQAKLVLVATLVVLDLRLTFRAKAFQKGHVEVSRRECMFLHGAISFVFLVVLVLVLTRPFSTVHRLAESRGKSRGLGTSYVSVVESR
jgi:putative membrane protein